MSAFIELSEPGGVWAIGTVEYNNTDSSQVHSVNTWINIQGNTSQALQNDVLPQVSGIKGFATTSVQYKSLCQPGTNLISLWAMTETPNVVKATHFDLFALGNL